MKLNTLIAVLTTAALSVGAVAQIKIKSKGEDVRTVIDTVFAQANMQYVLETTVRQQIFMSLDDISFSEATEIIGRIADLTFTQKGKIWYVNKRAKTIPTNTAAQPFVPASKASPMKPAPKNPATPISKPAVSKPEAAKPAKEKPTKEKPAAVKRLDLSMRLTARKQKADIREVFASFAEQTNVKIEVDETVPNYKIDAFMFNTSLKFALERVCKAAGLKFEAVDGEKIVIRKI